MKEMNPTTNQHWFRIRYTASAPEGLPPVLQAARMLRYAEGGTGATWLIALWDSQQPQDVINSGCILRVRDDHVASVTRHSSLVDAMNSHLFG